MKFETLIAHHGSASAAARALRLTPQAVSLWKKSGIVPYGKAFLAQLQSGGKIAIDESVYPPETLPVVYDDEPRTVLAKLDDDLLEQLIAMARERKAGEAA